MSNEHGVWVIFAFLGVFSTSAACWALYRASYLSRFMDATRVREEVQSTQGEVLRAFETRIKGLEVEWETVYDKLERLTRRKSPGRPPKEPDSLPLEAFGDPSKTSGDRRKAILARRKGT